MKRKIIFWSLLAVLLGIAVFSGYKLISTLTEYRKGVKTYEKLEKYVHLEGYEPGQSNVSEGEQQPEKPYLDVAALKEINPDFVGWIYIPDTNVNYPIVKGADNNIYLSKMFDGEKNASGSIFMDCGNTGDWTDYNTVIYGHNMKNKSMFAHVESYKDQAWFDAHPTGLLLTEHGNYELQFFAGYSAKTHTRAWELNFADDAAFAQWLQQAVDSSVFKSGITPTAEDRVVTLSTCTYNSTNVRFVLLAILKPLEY